MLSSIFRVHHNLIPEMFITPKEIHTHYQSTTFLPCPSSRQPLMDFLPLELAGGWTLGWSSAWRLNLLWCWATRWGCLCEKLLHAVSHFIPSAQKNSHKWTPAEWWPEPDCDLSSQLSEDGREWQRAVRRVRLFPVCLWWFCTLLSGAFKLPSQSG